MPHTISFKQPSASSHLLAALLICLSAGCGETTSTEQQAQDNASATEAAGDETKAPSEETDANKEPAVTTEDTTGKVLRHAVFFAFKEDSSPEDVQKVVDAFVELPSKIEQITGFQHGINNSPEGLNDGFTHCFVLTFADEAGRAAYLPHPAHKAFGDLLRPQMKDVFVVDYWGTPQPNAPVKALQHAVFFRFLDGADAEKVAEVEQAFAALPSKIDTIKGFEWGKNNSPETHDDGFTHCFMVTFDSEEGRDAYLPHPEHLAFVEILKSVLDAPRVLDFWTE